MATKTINLTDIEKYLSRAEFPCDKQMLITEAKDKDAPKEVIDALNSLPNREFSDVEDISSELDLDVM